MLSVYSSSLYEHRKWGIFSAISGYFYYASHIIDALSGISTIYEITGQYQKAAETQMRILTALKEEWGFSEETVLRETEQEIERLQKKIM